MKTFTLNGDVWQVKFVAPNSGLLVDRTNTHTVATTDPQAMCIYVADTLSGAYLKKVLTHEISHCAMVSFNLLDIIHTMVYPEYWIEAEELLCNYLYDYGLEILEIAESLVGKNAIYYLPTYYERLIG